jgi:hypothetical protein
MFFSFGKKRRKIRRGCKSKRPMKKIPAKIRKLCKRLKIKTTRKVGSRRVCKTLSVLMKQIQKKMRSKRRSGFGSKARKECREIGGRYVRSKKTKKFSCKMSFGSGWVPPTSIDEEVPFCFNAGWTPDDVNACRAWKRAGMRMKNIEKAIKAEEPKTPEDLEAIVVKAEAAIEATIMNTPEVQAAPPEQQAEIQKKARSRVLQMRDEYERMLKEKFGFGLRRRTMFGGRYTNAASGYAPGRDINPITGKRFNTPYTYGRERQPILYGGREARLRSSRIGLRRRTMFGRW